MSNTVNKDEFCRRLQNAEGSYLLPSVQALIFPVYRVEVGRYFSPTFDTNSIRESNHALGINHGLRFKAREYELITPYSLFQSLHYYFTTLHYYFRPPETWRIFYWHLRLSKSLLSICESLFAAVGPLTT